MNVLSLFSGVGGFDLGLERAGFTVSGQAEADDKAASVLRRHWPDVQFFNDVKEVNKHNVEITPDLICGGFPCQDLSLAGRRAGLGGARSGLWWEFHRIIEELTPQFVLIENVPGLLSSNRGQDMAAVVGSLAQSGYCVEWRVLDSRFFGVPQRRRRVFIAGHLGGPSGRSLLFESERVSGNSSKSQDEKQEATVGTLTGSATGGWRFGADEAAAGHLIPAYRAFHLYQDPISSPFSPALGATSGGMGVSAPEQEVRRLTPRECERLQGFQDDWTALADNGKKIADTHRYRFMGNAVTVPVVKWLGRRLQAAAQ